MRRLILIAMMVTAGCGISEPPPQDPWSPGAHTLYNDLVRDGWAPKEARDRVNATLEVMKQNEGRFDRRIAKREAETAEIRRAACRSNPDLDYC